ncbi:MAG: (Fe-S)-binding protein [Thermoplasmata archaeon]|jgi:Fe-S oxidoreductase
MINPTEVLQSFEGRMKDFIDGENFRKCIQCGICGGSCPFGFYTDFTPRRMITATRAELVNEIIESNAPWLCTSCNLCTSRCPSRIPITDALIPVLRELAMNYSHPPDELGQALTNIHRMGNSFGESNRKRAKWSEGLGFDVKILKKGEHVDYLFIVDDFGSFDLRAQEITRSVARLFKMLGIDFGILGERERSIGDHVRLAGEFGLFEEIARSNINEFRNYSFENIVTLDPHAYNSLKNEYRRYGFQSNVMHYTQILSERLQDLMKLMHPLNYTVTYHDPCYLGRKNGIYDEPRKIIESIPGVKFVEMYRNRENSYCCGGGGGGIWYDSYIRKFVKTRPAEERVIEAGKTGANVLLVSCPIDAIMFEDAVKVTGLEGRLRVMDISELILESIGKGV